MVKKGKKLEILVKEIEKYLLPDDFDVTLNENIYNDDGVQIAEFDIQIVGKVGSSTYKWLIECRDRPSQGPAPGAWIEQLVGRRDRFNFDKVTAVSTTDFASGAFDFAKAKGIELRKVDNISVETIADWFLPKYLGVVKQLGKLVHAELGIIHDNYKKYIEPLSNILSSSNSNSKILKSTKDGKMYSMNHAFQAAINQNHDIFEGLEPDSDIKRITLKIKYINPDDHYQIEVEGDYLDINEITFLADLSVTKTKVEISSIRNYLDIVNGKSISETVGFQFSIENYEVNLDIHRIEDKSESIFTIQFENIEN